MHGGLGVCAVVGCAVICVGAFAFAQQNAIIDRNRPEVPDNDFGSGVNNAAGAAGDYKHEFPNGLGAVAA